MAGTTNNDRKIRTALVGLVGGILLLLAVGAQSWPNPGSGSGPVSESTEDCALVNELLVNDQVSEALLVLQNLEKPTECLDAETVAASQTVRRSIATALAEAGLCDAAEEYDKKTAQAACQTSIGGVLLRGLVWVGVVGAAIVIVQWIGQIRWVVWLSINALWGRAMHLAVSVLALGVLGALELLGRVPLEGMSSVAPITWASLLTLSAAVGAVIRPSVPGRPRTTWPSWVMGISIVVSFATVAPVVLVMEPSLSDWDIWLALLVVGSIGWYELTLAVHGLEPPLTLEEPGHDGSDKEKADVEAALYELAASEPDGLDSVVTADDPDDIDTFIALASDETSAALGAVASLLKSNRRRYEYRFTWTRPPLSTKYQVAATLKRGSALVNAQQFDLADFLVPKESDMEGGKWGDERRRSLLFGIVAIWLLISVEDHFYGTSRVYGTKSWESAASTFAGAFWIQTDPEVAVDLFKRAVSEAEGSVPS